MSDDILPFVPGHLSSPGIRAALVLLLDACERARSLQLDPWEFALSHGSLRDAGLSDTDLRWLLRQGLAEQRVETTDRRSLFRSFAAAGNLCFWPRSCFVLTEKGLHLARRIGGYGAKAGQAQTALDPVAGPTLRPRWLEDQRELWLGDFRVRRFRRPAPNAAALLAAFEQAGWPERLDSPFVKDLDRDGRERLRDTVKRLNLDQEHALLRFHIEGAGLQVRWEIV